MNRRGQNDEQGTNLDRYADGDEATIRRHPASEAGVAEYEEEEVTTAPWLPRLG